MTKKRKRGPSTGPRGAAAREAARLARGAAGRPEPGPREPGTPEVPTEEPFEQPWEEGADDSAHGPGGTGGDTAGWEDADAAEDLEGEALEASEAAPAPRPQRLRQSPSGRRPRSGASRTRDGDRDAGARTAGTRGRQVPAVARTPVRRRPSGQGARPERGRPSTGARTDRQARTAQARERRRAMLVGLTPYPPLGISLARGLATVAGSVLILATSFLGTLLFWFAFSNYGVHEAPSPAAMVLLQSLAPVHSFLDLQFVTSGRTVPLAGVIGFGLALVVVRAALGSWWMGLLLEAFGGNRRAASAARPAFRRAVKALPVMIGVEFAFVGITLLSVILASFVLGPGLGQLAVIGALMGSGYFLILAPVVTVAEGRSLRDSMTLASRAARIPGPRHAVLSFIYLALALLISAVSPGPAIASATPSILVWAYALFVTYLHLSFLGAFTYRWLVARQSVLETLPEPRPAAE